MDLYKVKQWNKNNEGNRILVYTVGNGAFTNKPRERGYVVGNKRHSRFFMNYKDAWNYWMVTPWD